MKPIETDILVSGAGAAGLALAIELARRNVRFLLIDKAPEPFRGSRGKGIQPRTQEVFEDMGIVDRIVAAGGRYPMQRQYTNEGAKDETMMEAHEPTPSEPYAMPLMLPQFLTERIMRERLTELGHAPRFGSELMGFTRDADGVTATVKSGAGEEIIRAHYLVGTDGGRSFVRGALGIAFPGKTLGIRAVVADLALDGLTEDAWHRWNDGTAEQISLCPLRGTDLFQLQAPVPLEGDVDLSVEGIAAMIAHRTGRSDLVVHSVSWASAYNMNARLADRYRDGRVFLAGVAAHIHPPSGGQGLNTSIQDSYNLGWKLAAVLDGAPESLLDTYEGERRAIAADVLGLSTRLLDAATARGNMRRGREAHQLDLCYPDSALSFATDLKSAKVAPGDRAPDAPCLGAAGQRTRLFTLFRGPHWTLLGFGVDRTAVAPRKGLHIHATGPRGDVIDNDGHVHAAYGVESGWVLIRPDGYVSALVSSDALPVLEDHIANAGLRNPQV